MFNLAIVAPVGHGAMHNAVLLAKARGFHKPLLVSCRLEIRMLVEQNLKIDTIGVHQFRRQLKEGLTIDADVILFNSITPNSMRVLKKALQTERYKDLNIWLVNQIIK